MPEPIRFERGFEHSTARGLKSGLLDDPVEFAQEAVKGVGLGAAKIGYDTLSLGVDIGSSVISDDNPYKLDLGDNFWEVYSALDDSIEYGEIQSLSPVTKGFTEVTALAASTRAMAAKLAQWGKSLKVLEKTAHWKKTQAATYGLLGGFGADVVHTRKDDPSLFSLLPQEYQGDFARWMIDREEDSELEGRVKNAIEGGAFGLGLEVGSHLIFNSLKATKRMAHQIAGGDPQVLREVLEETASNGSGAFTESAIMNTLAADVVGLKGKDWIFMNKTTGTRMEVEEYTAAKARLERRSNILKGSKKKRAKKKGDKFQAELDSLNDGEFSPKEILIGDQKVAVDTAAEARMVQNAYTTEQLADDLPAKDLLRSKIDAKEVQDHVDAKVQLKYVADDTDDFIRKVLADSKASKEDKEFAKQLLENNRLNPGTSGDQMIDGAVELAGILGKNSKNTVPMGLPTGEFIFRAIKNARDGKVLDADVPGLSANANLTQMLAYLSSMTGETIPTLYTGLRIRRNAVAKGAVSAIDKALKKANLSAEDLQDITEKIIAFDKLDAYSAGTIGNVARLLKAQQINPNEMGKFSSDFLRQTLKKISGKAKDVDIDTEKLVKRKAQSSKMTERFKQMVDGEVPEDETRSLLNSYRTAINSNDANRLREVVEGPTFGRIMSSYIIGGMLSNPKTLITSVVSANAVSTLFKSVVIPTLEGVAGSAARTLSRNPSIGTSYTDGLLAMKVMTKQLGNFISNMFAGNNKKKLDDLFHLSYRSPREGTEEAAAKAIDIKVQLNQLMDRYTAEGAWGKKTLAQLAAPVIQATQPIINIVGRRITDVDTFYRGINNEVQIALEAERTWLREGGATLLDGVISQKEFTQKYTKYMRDYAAIQRSTDLLPDEKLARTTELFKGNDRLEQAVVDALDKAELVGRQATMQQEPTGLLSDVISTIDSYASRSSAGQVLLALTIPFRRTPLNMLNEIVDHSPGSIIATKNRDILFGKTSTAEEKLEVMTKMLSGTLVMGSVATLVGIDRLTGTFEPNERNQQSVFKQEHSIKIKDTWYSYRKLGPVAIFLSAMADAQNWSLDDPDRPYGMLFRSMLALTADESHMRTLSELLELAQTDDPDKVKRFFVKTVGNGLQPAKGFTDFSGDTLELILKGENPRYRSTVEKEVGESYKSFKALVSDAMKANRAFRWGAEKTGFAEYKLDLNIVGDYSYKHGDSTSGKILALMGVDNKDDNKSPGLQELLRRGLLSQGFDGYSIKGDRGSVKITPNQYKELNQKLFKSKINLQEELDRIVKSPGYNSMNEEAKTKYLRQVLDVNSKVLKRALYESDPKLQLQDYKNSLHKEYLRTKNLTPQVDSEAYWEHVRANPKDVRANNQAVRELIYQGQAEGGQKVDTSKLDDIRKGLDELGVGE